MCGRYVLLAPKIILGAFGLVVEIASVLNGDVIPLLGLVGAVALGDDFSSDTHCVVLVKLAETAMRAASVNER